MYACMKHTIKERTDQHGNFHSGVKAIKILTFDALRTALFPLIGGFFLFFDFDENKSIPLPWSVSAFELSSLREVDMRALTTIPSSMSFRFTCNSLIQYVSG